MATYAYKGTTQAATRCLSLWNGSSNNSPPAGWDSVGFNDSAWAFSANPGGGSGVDNKYPGQGIEIVAPWTSVPNAHASMLIRCHFNAPASPPYRYFMHDWDIATSSNVGGSTGWHLNGTTIATRDLISTNAGLVNFGGDNLLAIWIDMSPSLSTWTGSAGWFAFRYVFFIPDSGNTAYSWGTITTGVNDKGVLGVGDTLTHTTPTAVDTSGMGTDGGSILKIASNGGSTLFLCASGNVYASGDNSQGFLGTGSTDTSVHASPAQITSLVDIADVSIGGDCAIAVTRYGLVKMWGPNAHGSLGQGNTTAQHSPVTAVNLEGNNLAGAPGVTYLFESDLVGAGSDFSAIADPTSNTVRTAGGNAYGQLGQGTSGADVTSFSSVSPITAIGSTNSGVPNSISSLSAGDRQLVVAWQDVSFGHFVGCGRAVLGSLGNNCFSNGTGTDKINPTLREIEHDSGGGPPIILEVRQAAAITFQLFNSTFLGGRGDGVPHGGIPDASSTIVYGTTILHDRALITAQAIATLAYVSGGSQNSWASGDSRAAFAGVGTDGKLYTWGWGGAAQMGSGSDPTNNLSPVSINGLSNVIGATIAQAIMFSISGPPAITRHAGGWAAVIGD